MDEELQLAVLTWINNNHLNCDLQFEFRDKATFGKNSESGHHQMVNKESVEADIQNALHAVKNEGFELVLFYA